MNLVKPTSLKIFFCGTVLVAVIFAFFAFAPDVFAQQEIGLDETAAAAGFQQQNLAIIIGRIIAAFLGVLGVVFLVLVIYAGWLFMTAAGNDERVAKAKKVLTSAIIGLIIVLSSYAITAFVVQRITGQGIFGDGTGGEGDGGGVSIEPFSGSLGDGIRTHYPSRNETNVPRQAKIMVTFAEPMDLETLIDGYDTAGTPLDVGDDTVATALNDRFIKIYETGNGEDSAFTPAEVSVGFTDDLQTFVFTTPILGSSAGNVQYTVSLDDRLQTADGESILRDGGYIWSFTTGTELDLDPPTITRVAPTAGGTYDRNILVQITFSEAIDPTSIEGAGDSNIQTSGANSGIVDGIYTPSNEYRTVTFVPSDPCGVNSCGDTLYCLSAADAMTVLVRAATPGSSFPYDGIVDVSGNALDGDDNGMAGGDYTWDFTTTGDVRLSGPTITAISPDIEASDVMLDQEVVIIFDSDLMSSTVSSKNISLTSDPLHEMWYLASHEAIAGGTEVRIRHGVFLESTADQTYSYGVEVSEGVRDEYQNCFNPAKGPGKSGGTCGTNASAPYCCNGTPQSSACELF